MSRNSNVIPISIEAPSRQELSGLLYILQNSLGGEVKYISFYYDLKTKTHVAWFFCDVDNVGLVQKIQEGK